jgi:hypothetical protein
MVRPLVACAAVSVILSHPVPAQATPSYTITDVRAHLFYSDGATFSENLVGNPKIRALWNTPIGEGDAGAPSSATLVVVEISGKPGSYEAGRGVELAVRDGKREIFRLSQALSVLSDKGHAYAAFWLYDTGCAPLRISTALLGQRNPTRRVVDIPFHCGE